MPSRPGPRAGADALELRVVAGGVPSELQRQAIVAAVSQVLASRTQRRTVREPVWGAVGRLEARDGLRISSRAMLPRDRDLGAAHDGGRGAEGWSDSEPA
jgi:hypothetical protein